MSHLRAVAGTVERDLHAPPSTLAPIVGLGTLARLRELGSVASGPVLSVYLSLDDRELPPAAACGLQLRALIAGLALGARAPSGMRMHELLRSLPTQASGTRGLALFVSDDGSSVAAVALPERVEPAAAFAPVPWLEPLARLVGRASLAAERASMRELTRKRGRARWHGPLEGWTRDTTKTA